MFAIKSSFTLGLGLGLGFAIKSSFTLGLGLGLGLGFAIKSSFTLGLRTEVLPPATGELSPKIDFKRINVRVGFRVEVRVGVEYTL